jgi:rfaE bifunctional protein nucleotidyltransferase chain/domain/rfaE bifunctional protein kinase chain/domain
MSDRLIVIGDALLDRDVEGRCERLASDSAVPVLEESETRLRPGGAGLAATLAAAGGRPVTLLTAIAPEPAGSELARALLDSGVDLVDLRLDGRTPEKVRLLDDGRPVLRLDRGGAQGLVDGESAAAALRTALAGAAAVLVSDYGRGVASHPDVRAALAARPQGLPLVWDPHPRGAKPLAGASLATPNLGEAVGFAGREAAPGDEEEMAGLAAALARRWEVGAVAVTRGAEGALLASVGGPSATLPCQEVDGDPCGAGDRFAVEATLALAVTGDVVEAVRAAVAAATEFVRRGGARSAATAPRDAVERRRRLDASPLSIGPSLELAERVRRVGGTVVATGGCFDLLHLGHVRTLESARRLGDCLVVLVNGDRSIRRIKGSGRPLVGELERAAMLRALACVDEVAVFDEATPVDALRILRPHVWAKGGDYGVEELPESEAISSWGGRTAILPYLAGRSTTRLIEEVSERAAG